MEKRFVILGVLTLIGILGIIIFQMNVQGDPFLVGFGFTLSSISILIALGIGLINADYK